MTYHMGHTTHMIGQSMLQTLLGSSGSEKVLMFIAARGEGYAREISRFSGMGLYPVQRQLDRLEVGGILVSRSAGRTRLYSFNPEYLLLDELKGILDKSLTYYPEEERERLLRNRRRPGRMTQAELAAYVQEHLRQR